MAEQWIEIAPGFWNLRGSFRVGGLLDIGTHVSLIRRRNGKFLFLDSYTLSDKQAQAVETITGGSQHIEAILNLHPFHTIHVPHMHKQYPQAKLYGTARHVDKFPTLPWDAARCEHASLHRKFAKDLEFSVPRGVDFVSDNGNVHFSSVLALHPATQTIHVDDTLMYIRMPLPMRLIGMPDALNFHPTLAQALQKRAGAAQDFRRWAKELIEHWGDARNLCAAHTATLAAKSNPGAPIRARLTKALAKVEGTLKAHERKYG